MLAIGLEGQKSLLVDASMSAQAVGSGTLPVLSTPTMISLMEAAAMESVQLHLEEGQGTVGAEISARHLSATPVGICVRCHTKLILIEGRKLTFTIEAYDDAGLIGTASHVRYIIDERKFIDKAQKKLQNAWE